MSFLKETNYHGSRIYDGDPADQGCMDFGLRWSLALAWTALQLKKFGRLLLAAGEGRDPVTIDSIELPMASGPARCREALRDQ